MRTRPILVVGWMLGALWMTRSADAHFYLHEPPSWMSQDDLGLPQKLPPCGDEGGGTPTGIVTPFQAGETIDIQFEEKVFHPGHFRVALAVNDRSELPDDPPVTPDSNSECGSTVIQDPAVFPVLVDGALSHDQGLGGLQTISVTLPTDVTCEKCTLQIIQFMSSHGAPCFYHHCADISITAAGTGGAGNGGSGANGSGGSSAGGNGGGGGTGGGGGSGTGGTSTTGGGANAADSSDDGGCACSVLVRPSATLGLGATLVALLGFVWRRRRNARVQ